MEKVLSKNGLFRNNPEGEKQSWKEESTVADVPRLCLICKSIFESSKTLETHMSEFHTTIHSPESPSPSFEVVIPRSPSPSFGFKKNIDHQEINEGGQNMLEGSKKEKHLEESDIQGRDSKSCHLFEQECRTPFVMFSRTSANDLSLRQTISKSTEVTMSPSSSSQMLYFCRVESNPTPSPLLP